MKLDLDTSKLKEETLRDITRNVYRNATVLSETVKIFGGSPRIEYTVWASDRKIGEVANSTFKAWKYAVDRILKG